MFTILRNTNHGECVYNLIQQPSTQPPRQPMYRSRFSCSVRQENYCNKTGCSRTMGLPKIGLCPPQNYLKKNSRAPITILPPAVPKVRLETEKTEPKIELGQGDAPTMDGVHEPGKESCSHEAVAGSTPCECKEPVPRICCNQNKPPVPPYCRPFGIIPRGPKDFVRDNAAKVVRQPAKIAEPRFVDTAKGSRQDWCPSGYPRKYVCRADYGEVPAYLVERKKEILAKNREIAENMKKPDVEAAEACRHMSNEERCSLLLSLKNTWAETYRDFQSLPLLIDSLGKIKRKSELEGALLGLEKDIQLIERHNNIFLADTDKSFYLA